MSEYLRKLSKLFDFVAFGLLEYLSTEAVIAGGSIVYATNDHVSVYSVGDIDVYINSKDKFSDIVEFIQRKCHVERMESISPNTYLELEEDNTDGISIVTVFIKNERVSLQLILQEYNHPKQIIESFDLDYVQCALHKGEVYKTEICVDSHRFRKVIFGSEFPPSLKRLQKAHLKGFEVPIFGDEGFHVNSIVITKVEESKLKFIKPREKSNEIFSLEQINATSFIPNTTKKDRDFEIVLYMIRLRIANKNIDVKSITIPIVIIGTFEDCVRILPISIGDVIIEYIKNKNIKVEIGKFYARLEFHLYIDKSRSRELLKARLCKLYAFEDAPIVPVNISNIEYKLKTIQPKDEISRLIEKHKTESNGESRYASMEHAKCSAYRAFLYYKKEEGELAAIRKACSQMSIDAGKVNKNNTNVLFFSLISYDYKTIDEMIRFIEGFN